MIKKFLRAVSDMRVTLACTLLLMLAVLVCTLDQTRMSAYSSVEKSIRSFFYWWTLPGGARVPVFPAGALIGSVYLLNLIAAFFVRLPRDARKAGMWLVHAGILLLVAGEFLSGYVSRESQLSLREGEARSFSEMPDRTELAVIDPSDPKADRVLAIGESELAREGAIRPKGWPFELRVRRYFPNAGVSDGAAGTGPAADSGMGAGHSLSELPPAASGGELDAPGAMVEVSEAGRPLGVWLLSRLIGRPQEFAAGGKTFNFELRAKRRPLPFSLALLDFKRETYPGSDIPKSFSSRLRLRDASSGEDREVLISMNNPLRYRGFSVYQSGFGENDRLSILQVVENPGRLLPYIACVLTGLGLLLHFGWGLLAAQGRRS